MLEDNPFTKIFSIIGLIIGFGLPSGFEFLLGIDFPLIAQNPEMISEVVLIIFISTLIGIIGGIIGGFVGFVVDKLRV